MDATCRLDAAWLRQGALAQLLAVLNDRGEEARVVGGAVRNALLGEPIGEIDLATTAVPDEVVRRATAAGFKPVPTGIEHGTVTVVIEGQPFEVTTLREDVETFGRHANVRFGRDWRKDAERRDFTMNALSVSGDGMVHDYVGGIADLKARRVRFIGDAATRIAEDHLRILRFFRFHAALRQRIKLLECRLQPSARQLHLRHVAGNLLPEGQRRCILVWVRRSRRCARTRWFFSPAPPADAPAPASAGA